MVENKAQPKTPDDVCLRCHHNWYGKCKALDVPKSDMEISHRQGWGMECHPTHLKEYEHQARGISYELPEGRFDQE